MPEKVIIIGSGPAGWTAAVYAARANLSPLVFSGSEPGGQLMMTTEVENFPGFSAGILGPDLMNEMKKQAERFGTRIIDQKVDEVDFRKYPFLVRAGGCEYEARSVIISTGATARWLGLPSERAFYGKGVSACATCDGYFFKNKKVIVVGGGDAALEEAMFLTKFADAVTVVVRRDTLRASKIMRDRAKNNPKISFIWNTEVVEILGDGYVTGVRLKNNKTNEISEMKIDGVFAAIGHEPATSIFKGQIDSDEKGYVIVKSGDTATNIPGVFAAGDVADHKYRQAITAAGTGCMAAIDAEKWLEQTKN
ncbi:thioredoxin-disulfide reductase [Candidatus Uhrbacteria bacterium]|nr:thioredoxin-disulfide reductase [Candidatus Uhrbacteria bacterium]